jgi:predicted O-methyltransferase YrrM
MRPEEMQKIKELLKLYIDNSIVYHGWSNKNDLTKSWLEADIWFYPCTYKETFCHTAYEAAISKTFIITNHLAAPRDTVGDRGYILKDGNFYDESYQNDVINDIFKAIDNIELRNELIEKNYNYVKEISWKNRANFLLNNYILNNKLNYMGMYNWTNNIPLNSYNQFLQILYYIKWKNTGKIINILEIGTYTGTSIIKILEILPNSQATVIDTWKNYNENNLKILSMIEENNVEQIFYKNIEISNMKDRIKVYKGDSANILLNNIGNFDFIYVDGSHKLLDLHLDLILSFNILNKGGILGIDDYLYNKEDIFESPYEGVNHFLEKYKNRIKILLKEYRVFIEKL